jgi:hypothetical protein
MVLPQHDDGGASHGLSSAEIESPGPAAAAVMGRPFPISTSVATDCRRLAGTCDEGLQLLSKMVQEPRDAEWAKEMESRLRAHFLTAQPGKYSIRAIECRSTVCAAEVASPDGPYLGGPYSFVAANDLYNGPSFLGYETGELGATVTVTPQMFERR